MIVLVCPSFARRPRTSRKQLDGFGLAAPAIDDGRAATYEFGSGPRNL